MDCFMHRRKRTVKHIREVEMGFFFGGLKAQVTITGGITTAPPTYPSTTSYKGYANAFTNSSSPTTLVTPTAGKVFYLTSVIVDNNNDLQVVSDGSTAILLFKPTYTDSGLHQLTFSVPIPFSTNLNWKTTGTSGTQNVTITGYEL
jgi:hypothetical protein